MADNANSKAPEAADVSEDLVQLRADFARLSDTVSGLLRSHAGTGADKVRDVASSTHEAFNAMTGSVSKAGNGIVQDTGKRLNTLGSELEGTFRENPTSALVTAAALGLVVGLLTR
jgi:ElaB/YqjD/DUF883 family membrane-anchored ribosome-binding protein